MKRCVEKESEKMVLEITIFCSRLKVFYFISVSSI